MDRTLHGGVSKRPRRPGRADNTTVSHAKPHFLDKLSDTAKDRDSARRDRTLKTASATSSKYLSQRTGYYDVRTCKKTNAPMIDFSQESIENERVRATNPLLANTGPATRRLGSYLGNSARAGAPNASVSKPERRQELKKTVQEGKESRGNGGLLGRTPRLRSDIPSLSPSGRLRSSSQTVPPLVSTASTTPRTVPDLSILNGSTRSHQSLVALERSAKYTQSNALQPSNPTRSTGFKPHYTVSEDLTNGTIAMGKLLCAMSEQPLAEAEGGSDIVSPNGPPPAYRVFVMTPPLPPPSTPPLPPRSTYYSSPDSAETSPRPTTRGVPPRLPLTR